MTPKVSVLMPVFNAERYLSQAIDSIVEQSFTDWELILINDGSTDGSEAIISSYTDSRIKYWKNEENKGLIYTRNLMIEKASGEYIAFLDSDDLSMSERLQKQVDFLDNNLDYGLCGTWSLMIDRDGKQLKKINMPTDHVDICCSLLFINTFVQSSIMIRRKILVENPYDKEYPLAEDYELWCRLSRKYKLKNIPLHLTKYRWHGDNISKSRKEHLDALTQNIYRRELALIGIDATDYELTIHSAIRDASILVGIVPKAYLNELKAWLGKLADAGVASCKYDSDILLATIAFRWVFACKSRKLYLKVFSLPISLSRKGYTILFRMLRERI